jgi:hypothetical protein
LQSTLTPLAVAFIIIGQILVDQVNHGCIIGKKSYPVRIALMNIDITSVLELITSL